MVYYTVEACIKTSQTLYISVYTIKTNPGSPAGLCHEVGKATQSITAFEIRNNNVRGIFISRQIIKRSNLQLFIQTIGRRYSTDLSLHVNENGISTGRLACKPRKQCSDVTHRRPATKAFRHSMICIVFWHDHLVKNPDLSWSSRCASQKSIGSLSFQSSWKEMSNHSKSRVRS